MIMIAKVIISLVLTSSLLACNNSGTVESKLDSLKNSLDTTMDKIGDSIDSKSERLVDDVKDRVNAARDSADIDSAQ